MRALLALTLIGCTPSSGTPVPIANGGAPAYHVRAYQHISADGKTGVTIAAFGTLSDGTFATDPIVFNTDRASSGRFDAPAQTLGARGATATFTPCDSTDAGCTGPVNFTIALASAPTVPIAQIGASLDPAPLIGSIEQCSGSDNVLFLEGAGFIYTGKLTVTGTAFSISGADKHAQIVVPTADLQGPPFTLVFDTVQLNVPLATGVFQDAVAISTLGRAQLSIASTSVFAHCDFTPEGEFQVYDYDPAHGITVSFRDWCDTSIVSGCLHVQQ